jgi:two-component system copper resistance phosphate regulon response regulator CusR
VRILIVEDSDTLRRSLGRGLKKLGHAVDLAADGEEGLGFVAVNDYDVIVLDLMLPRVDGWSFLKRLRANDHPAHVLILSAKDQVEDRVNGLELGADDYLVKPFSFDELRARLDALARRRHEKKSPLIRIGEVEIDTALHQVRRKGDVVELTPKEYMLLECLVLRRGRVLTRQQIIDQIYDSETHVGENIIDVLVCNIRRKLQENGDPAILQTRRGYGYFVPE